MNKLYDDIDKIDLFRKGELAEKEEGEVLPLLMPSILVWLGSSKRTQDGQCLIMSCFFTQQTSWALLLRIGPKISEGT